MRSDPALRAGRGRLLLRELRAPFFTASATSVLLGTALAYYRTGGWDWALFLAALAGVVLLHAGANVANDYYDHKSGNDEANTEYVRPFTGGSRLIQQGLLSPREVLALATACFAAVLLPGAYLVYRCGLPVLALAAAGFLGGFFYSAPPVRFAARGLGEVVVALEFGVLAMAGAWYVQTGRFAAEVFVLSLTPALLVGAILFINQFQDMKADAAVGKRHWVVRLGRRRASRVYAVLALLWTAPILAGVAAGWLPRLALAALAPVALAAAAIRVAWTHFDDPARMAPANALTILLHLSVGGVLSGALILARIVGWGGDA